ncbi:MAG: hypothetical protein M3O71_15745 [Bacteroidota bacterium]|nr:hypothetical protein [Bacteroidota bacterium]
MSLRSKLFSKSSYLTAAFCSAILAEHAGVLAGKSQGEWLEFAAPVMAILGHVVTDELVVPLGEEILEQLKTKGPEQVNAEIKLVLSESIESALMGVKTLYKQLHPDDPLDRNARKAVNSIPNKLIELFSPTEKTQLENAKFRKILYSPKKGLEQNYQVGEEGSDVISLKLNEILSQQEFIDHVNESYRKLLAEKFLPLTRFYFGEALKKNRNSGARRALERMLSEDTLASIQKLIHEQEMLNEKLTNNNFSANIGRLSKAKIDQLKTIINDINQPKKLQVAYSKALDERFNELNDRYNGLQNDLHSIETNISRIRHTLWINSLFGQTIIIACAVTASVLTIYFFQQPFNISIELLKDKNFIPDRDYPEPEYPLQLRFQFNDKIEMIQFNSDQTALLPDVGRAWNGKSIHVKMSDRFWQLSDDKVILTDSHLSIYIKPTSRLAHVTGFVSSYITGYPIAHAMVMIMGDTILYTDKNGIFNTVLPTRMLQKTYRLTVTAPGFESKDCYYYPNSSLHLKLDVQQ